MNPLVLEMVQLAEDTSKQIGEEYTTVSLTVTRHRGITQIKFQGYTHPGCHTLNYDTLRQVAESIQPARAELPVKIKELREEADRLERMILKGGAS